MLRIRLLNQKLMHELFEHHDCFDNVGVELMRNHCSDPVWPVKPLVALLACNLESCLFDSIGATKSAGLFVELDRLTVNFYYHLSGPDCVEIHDRAGLGTFLFEDAPDQMNRSSGIVWRRYGRRGGSVRRRVHPFTSRAFTLGAAGLLSGFPAGRVDVFQ
jgi:hypothetical protein